MSELPPAALPPSNEPLRNAVRRMRWFRAAFEAYVEDLGRQIGCTYAIDDAKLAEIFVRWLRAVEQQRPSDKSQRRAFFEFAAGLMLRELTANMPLKAGGKPDKAAPDSAAGFWPEGYACTLFCLTVHMAAMAQEFDAAPTLTDDFDDLRQWWSFRENSVQDASFSVGFLQVLLGNQPNWAFPDVFRARLQSEITAG